MSCWCNINVSLSKVSHIYGLIMNFFRIIRHIFVYMKYIYNLYIPYIDNLSICCMDENEENFFPIQHMEILSIFYMDIKFSPIQHMDNFSIFCTDVNIFFIRHKIVHMLYGRLHKNCALVQTD